MMRKKLIGVGVLVAALSSAVAGFAAGWVPGTKPAAIRSAKAASSYAMKDPASSRFRNVQAFAGGVCGEVNGKNSHGAYAGFAPFYVPTGRPAEIYPGDLDYDRVVSAVNFYITSPTHAQASFDDAVKQVRDWCGFVDGFARVCEVDERFVAADRRTCAHARDLIQIGYRR